MQIDKESVRKRKEREEKQKRKEIEEEQLAVKQLKEEKIRLEPLKNKIESHIKENPDAIYYGAESLATAIGIPKRLDPGQEIFFDVVYNSRNPFSQTRERLFEDLESILRRAIEPDCDEDSNQYDEWKSSWKINGVFVSQVREGHKEYYYIKRDT